MPTSKNTVLYTPSAYDYIVVGKSANVFPTNHKSVLVSNKNMVFTSEVLSYDKETGKFETLNSIYERV